MPQELEYRVNLQITCQHPPIDRGHFGLQDKDQELHPPAHKEQGLWVFECTVRVKQNEKSGIPNFLGELAHGTPQERFLYLSLRPEAGPADAWIRRIKVPLKHITWEQVMAAAGQEGARLACIVDGTRSGTVRLVGNGWQIVQE